MVRPASNAGAAGVAVLQSADDLAWYARSLAEGWARIPEGTLSMQSGVIPLPQPPAARLILEPYINPDRCACVILLRFLCFFGYSGKGPHPGA